jgi:hypothetical protein
MRAIEFCSASIAKRSTIVCSSRCFQWKIVTLVSATTFFTGRALPSLTALTCGTEFTQVSGVYAAIFSALLAAARVTWVRWLITF